MFEYEKAKYPFSVSAFVLLTEQYLKLIFNSLDWDSSSTLLVLWLLSLDLYYPSVAAPKAAEAIASILQ